MTGWTPAELDAIDGTGEVDVATRRGDGRLRSTRIVWVVRHDDAVYVRSVNGTSAVWYLLCLHDGRIRSVVDPGSAVFLS